MESKRVFWHQPRPRTLERNNKMTSDYTTQLRIFEHPSTNLKWKLFGDFGRGEKHWIRVSETNPTPWSFFLLLFVYFLMISVFTTIFLIFHIFICNRCLFGNLLTIVPTYLSGNSSFIYPSIPIKSKTVIIMKNRVSENGELFINQ